MLFRSVGRHWDNTGLYDRGVYGHVLYGDGYERYGRTHERCVSTDLQSKLYQEYIRCMRILPRWIYGNIVVLLRVPSMFGRFILYRERPVRIIIQLYVPDRYNPKYRIYCTQVYRSRAVVYTGDRSQSCVSFCKWGI